jgi:hypothetical protein
MSAILLGMLLVAVGGGVTFGFVHLLPRRWSLATRLAVADLAGVATVSAPTFLAPSIVPDLDSQSWNALLGALLLPQYVIVLYAMFRALDREIDARPPSHPPADDGTASIPVAAVPSEIAATARRSSASRFWHGDYELGIVFWGLTPLVFSISQVPFASIEAFLDTEPRVGEAGYMTLLVGSLCLMTLVHVFTLVGTWRSAARRARSRRALGRHRVWPRLTQALVVFGWLSVAVVALMVGFLTRELPVLIGGDPTIPAYSWRTMGNGTEAELTGGLRLGVARDLVALLRATPTVRLIHLDSPGGRGAEGIRLFNVIRRHHLDTYVGTRCASACTMALGGGVNRWIDRSAEIGFHQGDTDLIPEFIKAIALGFASRSIREVYIMAGFDSAFVDRVLATPNRSITVPRPHELLAAGVATAVVERGRFALSGLGSDPRSETFGRNLLNRYPALRTAYAAYKDEAAWDRLWADVVELWRVGATADAVGTKIDDTITELALAELADMRPETLTTMMMAWSKIFATVGSDDPARCPRLAAGRDERGGRLPIPDHFAAARAALAEAVIIARRPNPTGMSDARRRAALEAFRVAARRDLSAADAALVTDPPSDTADPARLCAAWAAALDHALGWGPEIRRLLALRFGV